MDNASNQQGLPLKENDLAVFETIDKKIIIGKVAGISKETFSIKEISSQQLITLPQTNVRLIRTADVPSTLQTTPANVAVPPVQEPTQIPSSNS